ncbi:unnamed protein product [Didymodactylos carnosus]|uniref:F-box domain-containing protein n=1 Tax=Didymodactylos carnosus TaxID=1234261 RepID=A0A815EEC7_9BILA|nr:unnamed protein product [Didymodactylos carnosus]CAF1476145.1 unnamed protein product [Didymodactylos carnosus]CAF4153458.1 unnamed protein product [Didymodactylos carnosus]CAF4267235.1 unnamed protein product [Didymodactylos carnosus]
MPPSFCDLPNEVILMVFDDLGSTTTLCLFYGLNHRFNQLLGECCYRHLNFTSWDHELILFYLENVAPVYGKYCKSLTLDVEKRYKRYQQLKLPSFDKLNKLCTNIEILDLYIHSLNNLEQYKKLFNKINDLSLSVYYLDECEQFLNEHVWSSKTLIKCSIIQREKRADRVGLTALVKLLVTKILTS